MATAGRILIIPKGEWNEGETYEMLDLVNHGGTTWLAKKHSIGIAPSTDTSDYWFNLIGVTTKDIQIANNLVTTQAGYVLDARQGKALMDAIESANTKVRNVETSVSTLQTSLADTKTSLSGTQTSLSNLSNSVTTLQNNATVTKGTLAVGATSIVLSNSRITTNSILSIYTSKWGVNPTSVTVASGKVTLGFDAQTVAVEVGVRVDG